MARLREKGGRRRRGSENRGQKAEGRGQKADRKGRSSPAREDQMPGTVMHGKAGKRALRRLLEGIGSPAPTPFKPDPFQLEALAALEHEDVLVTAPTGSGKTWIAREEIRRLLAAGKRAWYTSPLKALTNSKYQEFR